MGNTFCISSKIEVSINNHILGTFTDETTTLALENGSNNKYATHIASNYTSTKK